MDSYEYEQGRRAGRLRGVEICDWAFAECEKDERETSRALKDSEEYAQGVADGLKEALEVAQRAIAKRFDLDEFNYSEVAR